MTYAIQVQAIPFQQDLENAALMIRLEKAVEKLTKLKNKGSIDDMIKAML